MGFTKICDAVEPWDVIDMLNQLYTIMDHLASRFNLYKVETIGELIFLVPNHTEIQSNLALFLAIGDAYSEFISPVPNHIEFQSNLASFLVPRFNSVLLWVTNTR